MQVELNLLKELLTVYDSVKRGYLASDTISTDRHLQYALARLDVLINILKGE